MTGAWLFPDLAERWAPRDRGILPAQAIRALVRGGEVSADAGIDDDMVQPASLDLRLGPAAHRVRASFLPGPGVAVEDKIRRFEVHRLDLSDGAVLERGCVYIVPLQERLALGDRLSAFANPKSSTGRLDVFTRVITDHATQFDVVRNGYRGPLYAEVSPRTFGILAREGSRLAQLRFQSRGARVGSDDLWRMNREIGLIDAEPVRDEIREYASLRLKLDLSGEAADGLAGYRAQKHTRAVDVDRTGHYDPAEFWEPIRRPAGQGIILDPHDFHILVTREEITVPPDHAAEMVAYDTRMGEFRVHYAGFFDPGFGHDPDARRGNRAVLEVRSHDVPFLLEHEQVIGRLHYERLTEASDKLYGPGIGSSYQGQTLALGKQFRQVR